MFPIESFTVKQAQSIFPPVPDFKKINNWNSQNIMDFDVVTPNQHQSICIDFLIHSSPGSPLCGWCRIIQTIAGFSPPSFSLLYDLSFVGKKIQEGKIPDPAGVLWKAGGFEVWPGLEENTRGIWPWYKSKILHRGKAFDHDWSVG